MRKYFSIILAAFLCACSGNASLNSFTSEKTNPEITANIVKSDFQFNGFTEYWHNVYEQRLRYGNLYRLNLPNAEAAILQSKVNLAEDLQMPGLIMQEGFIDGLFQSPYTTLESPALAELEEKLKTGENLLVLTDTTTAVGKSLLSTYKRTDIATQLQSHQLQSPDYQPLDAFVLNSGSKKLYAVVATNKKELEQFKTIVSTTEKLLNEYELKKGWLGAQTLLKSVTCTPGTPIELIGKGMNEGNSWFVFDGYMEFLAKDEIEAWAKEVALPVVTDVGFSPVYGCENYDGFQVQSLFTPESWVQYAKSKNGYAFRPVYSPAAEGISYDGYIAQEGNMDQINHDGKPFILGTGSLKAGVTNSMVLFHKKGEPFSKASIWKNILETRAVGVLEEGKMMGPAAYRHALQLLLLDRVFLEEYFGDKVDVDAVTNGNKLMLTIRNGYAKTVEGKLQLTLPGQLSVKGEHNLAVSIPANGATTLSFDLLPSPDAMGRPNPIGVQLAYNDKVKTTAAMLELPPAISTHQLLYGNASGTSFPVTLHNFTSNTTITVKISVVDFADSSKVIYSADQTVEINHGSFKTVHFDLKVPAGSYLVKTEAMGVVATTQLGIESGAGNAAAEAIDIDNDGVDEYHLENEQVKITLIPAGARVIDYTIKSRKDNILFKLWPEKPIDDRRPFRNREFYPYGGFEDFLGQPSIETHKIYDAEIVKKEGEYVQVKMKANYFGNTIEKIFTLYGNSPLLEIRFALTMRNAELSMLGPQPILELGKIHGPEDKFIIPEMDGLHEYRMMMDKYFGRAFFIKEGWNAGYDTKEDIAFIGSFPVKQPIFLHMWMNHPVNPGSHYYYAEFQPWTPLSPKTTTYFSYYMWGAGGAWEKSLQAMRDRNLITER